MKRTEKLPSIYQQAADELFAFLIQSDEEDRGLKISDYKIKPIPYGSKQRGREVLHIQFAPRHRIPSGGVIVGDFDPYSRKVIKTCDGWGIEPSTPTAEPYDRVSIYADLAEVALSILTTRIVVNNAWCEWRSLEEHLRAKGPRNITVWNSDNYNDWRIFGSGNDDISFIGACWADINQSVLQLVAHSNVQQGLAAANRQFRNCAVIFDD
jgi:hypothetical protein